jgi:uncharacterized protein
VIVYAESSAVLAWLLGEPSQTQVLRELQGAERVVSSTLTAVECARGLARARASSRLSAADELAARHLLDIAEASWDVHDLSERIMTRARGLFPAEPVRTLDALHIATALVFQEAFGAVSVLSFDDRIRENARALGMVIAPK